MLLLIGEQDRLEALQVVDQCTQSYLAAFSVSYSLGVLFGLYAMLRVLAQYKEIAVIRSNPNFQFRNRVLSAFTKAGHASNLVARSIGTGS